MKKHILILEISDSADSYKRAWRLTMGFLNEHLSAEAAAEEAIRWAEEFQHVLGE